MHSDHSLRDRWIRHSVTWPVIGGLLLLGTAVVYATGGTTYAFPYVMLVPVLMAAARYETPGGIAAAVAAALLLGPFMPLEVDSGTYQSTANWLTRLAFFVLVGGTGGWLFASVRAQGRVEDRLAREDRPTGLPNRTALEERIEEALGGRPFPERDPPVLFIVRITDFFEALDAVGADAGDALAAATAELIESADLGVGSTYRFSAAEFAFVANNLKDDAIAAKAAAIKEIGEQPVDVRRACTG